jgi:nucleoside-diphosphate-sugar epimerase
MANAFGLLKKYNKRFIFASSQMSNMSYSPYGVLKNVGELYTKSLNGLIVKFWNVYGIEKDYDKAHVITDFIRKGLYAEDCCEALETIMESFDDFTSEDNLHITSFYSTKIVDVASIILGQFNILGKDVKVVPSEQKDTVQMDKRNKADSYVLKWWQPKTTIEVGIQKVFNSMKDHYDNIV